MAVNRIGWFDSVATSSHGTIGCYKYVHGTTGDLFAGDFYIDTGIDDPVDWAPGIQGAMIYGARVYMANSRINPSQPAGTAGGTWRIKATPMWSSTGYVQPGPSVANLRRIVIHCEAYLVNPPSSAANAYYLMDQVAWTLYKL